MVDTMAQNSDEKMAVYSDYCSVVIMAEKLVKCSARKMVVDLGLYWVGQMVDVLGMSSAE